MTVFWLTSLKVIRFFILRKNPPEAIGPPKLSMAAGYAGSFGERSYDIHTS